MVCGGCNNYNGSKSNGGFQSSLGSWRSIDRRLSRTSTCINNKKEYTHSDLTITNDGRGSFINRKFKRMGVNTFNANNKFNALNNNANRNRLHTNEC